MSLSIDPALAPNNPLGLSQSDLKLMKLWDSMTDDQKGEYLFKAKQAESDALFLDSINEYENANSNVIQTLAGGGAQVGGTLRPDALITVQGIEMTVQQAIDAGVRSSESLGLQTADLG